MKNQNKWQMSILGNEIQYGTTSGHCTVYPCDCNLLFGSNIQSPVYSYALRPQLLFEKPDVFIHFTPMRKFFFFITDCLLTKRKAERQHSPQRGAEGERKPCVLCDTFWSRAHQEELGAVKEEASRGLKRHRPLAVLTKVQLLE